MLDVFLVGWLVLGLPALGIARDARTKNRMRSSQPRRWLAAICLSLSAVAVVLSEWRATGRPLAHLWLGWPPTPVALFCLAGSAAILGVIAVVGTRTPPRAAAEEAGLNPRTPSEWLVFVLFCVSIGVGWEMLYRGYLLWWLGPRIGLPGAVGLSVLAYGAGHGVRNPVKLAASLGSALAFTLGAVFSHSLYWLMLAHAGAPLIGAALLSRSERLERRRLRDTPQEVVLAPPRETGRDGPV